MHLLGVALALALAPAPAPAPAQDTGGAGAAAKARRLAIIPVAAERITAEAIEQLRRMDDVLHRAAAGIEGVVVQPEAHTLAELAAVRDLGISCEPDDVACLSKVAVLVDADQLVVPIVRFERERTSLRILLVDGAGRHADASRAATGDITIALARATLVEALAAPMTTGPTTSPLGAPAMTATSPTPAVTTTPPTTTTTTTTATAEPAAALATDTRPPDTAAGPRAQPGAPPLWIAGAAVASVGAVLAVGAGVGAFAVNESLVEKEPWDDRVAKIVGGQALLYGAILGAVAVAAGGVMIALATDAP